MTDEINLTSLVHHWIPLIMKGSKTEVSLFWAFFTGGIIFFKGYVLHCMQFEFSSFSHTEMEKENFSIMCLGNSIYYPFSVLSLIDSIHTFLYVANFLLYFPDKWCVGERSVFIINFFL